MSENQSELSTRATSSSTLERAVLGILLAESPQLLSESELVTAVGEERLCVLDAVSELEWRGLVHRLSGFVFASRAAREVDALRLSFSDDL